MSTSTKQSSENSFANAWIDDPNVAARYVNAENATLPFAKIMVEKSGLSQLGSEDAHVFDHACGTGAVIQKLYDAVPKEKWGQLKVLGGDVSPPMLEYLKAKGQREGWVGLETKIVNGSDIDLPLESFTHIFLSFGIFGMPGVLPKLYALLKPGGFIGISTWASLPWHSLLARSISHVPSPPYTPSATELSSTMYAGRPWGSESYLVDQLSDAGFNNVQTVRRQIVAQCGTPQQFVDTMQMPLQLVAGLWPEENRKELLGKVSECMLDECIKDAGSETHSVSMEFDGAVAWGWK